MSTISVYAFLDVDAREGDYESFTTQDYREADEYARQHGYAVIELEYEYADSSLIVDYREGHALDGTPLDEDEDDDGS